MSDDQAFRSFAAARAPALLRTAYLLTTDRHQAEDLLQTTLTKVFLAWGRLRDPQAAEAYARRTMIRAQASWWRRRSSYERPSPDGELPAANVPDAVDPLVERDRVWRALATLPRQQRAVLVLRFYEDLSVNAVADLMGISAGSVKTHTSRAFASLRGRLDESDMSPGSGAEGGA